VPILQSVRAVFERHPRLRAGVTLANSFPGLAFRPGAKKEWEEGIVIGLSGEGILPISYLTWLKRPTRLPISGNADDELPPGRRFPGPRREIGPFCTLPLITGSRSSRSCTPD